MRFLLALLCAIFLITPLTVKAAEPIPVYEYTEDDVKDLGDAAWLENGHTGKTKSDNRQCLIGTMAVALNRWVSDESWMRSSKYTGIRSVIMAPGQYAEPTKKGLGKTDTPDWVYDLAEECLIYGTNVPSYVIFQSMQSKLGTVWKIIDGEYFATGGGHKMEGKDLVLDTNKKQYELEQKRLEQEFKKKIQEIVGKSYQNFSRLLAYKQAQQNKN